MKFHTFNVVKAISVNFQWGPEDNFPDLPNKLITVGLLLNATRYDELLTMGPPADQAEV